MTLAGAFGQGFVTGAFTVAGLLLVALWALWVWMDSK